MAHIEPAKHSPGSAAGFSLHEGFSGVVCDFRVVSPQTL